MSGRNVAKAPTERVDSVPFQSPLRPMVDAGRSARGVCAGQVLRSAGGAASGTAVHWDAMPCRGSGTPDRDMPGTLCF